MRGGWGARSTTKENIFPQALRGRLWQAGGAVVGRGKPWDQLFCTGPGRTPGWKGICGGSGEWAGCSENRGGCARGQGAGPPIHGKETCGAGKRVGWGVMMSRDGLSPGVRATSRQQPQPQRVSHFLQEARRDSPQVWDGGPHCVSHCTGLGHYLWAWPSRQAPAFPRGSQGTPSHSPDLCDGAGAEQDLGRPQLRGLLGSCRPVGCRL